MLRGQAMAVEWRLRQVLETHGIRNASQLKTALERELGVRISRVALDKLIKNPPDCIRLKTAQILCDFLQLPLEALLRVHPEPIIKHSGGVMQPYVKPEKPVSSVMIDPAAFF
jgi:hypothetical protein